MNTVHDKLVSLNLPQAVHAQAIKLLVAIGQANTVTDCHRAADRAEGFGLGLETIKALNAASIEGLYLAFDDAAQTRLAEFTS
ncbi:hypothetical protein [Pseudomonas sp. G5(2012)]|uniref:hypothetical protein n=1 Tax=Pseudomonas sp. G5(2012) TaxID=1268068 RepID=UPI00034316B7|nr:hypothetical protein [Pseudomonas sp. G5(2012)]EPA99441.1 hypothetical protein PG5_02480 [Pseudomonas sp. G5(2012)]